MAESQNVVVIGGGISGLACAYRLRQAGIPVTLLEADGRVGGLIGTVEQDGFLFESGPQSFRCTDILLTVIRELGLEDELCKADPRAPRFVLRNGRLLKVPMSPQEIFTASLLGVGSRWKVLSEPLRRTKPPNEEESVAKFVRRKFGHEILEYLVAPFVSGVYAGDPEKLSLRAAFPSLDEWEREHGSVLRGAMKSRSERTESEGTHTLCSFRRGMRTLIDGMATKLGEDLMLKACASELIVSDSSPGQYHIRLTEDGRTRAVDAGAVVISTPAHSAAHFIGRVSEMVAKVLSGVAYAPVAVVGAGYYAKQFGKPANGFGVLIPRAEKLRTLGTVWNSSLFPGRASEGRVTMTSFIGGATDPEIIHVPEDEIANIVHRDNQKILEISGPPVAACVWKHARALPQYNLGHAHVVNALRDCERATPGVFFAGNYLGGPSIGKCIEQGFGTAEAVREHLRNGRNTPR
jgi:protoporphyrinogen/coproporphyrinogen III oxidase